MSIRATKARDWRLLKQVRFGALLKVPTAFGMSYQAAIGYDCEQWKQRASSTGTEFWLAFDQSRPLA